jgi:hypothetical protein
MNCQRVQDSFLDYQDGSLPADEAAQLRTHLGSCPNCQREWAALQEITRKLDSLPAPAPSPRLREQFYAMLETHEREASHSGNPFAFARSRIDRFFEALLPHRPSLQFAFSLALLAGGVLVGARLLAPKPLPVSVPVADESAKQELAALKRRIDDMDQLVVASLLQQKSTSVRLQAVLATLDDANPDRKVLTDLVGALALDPSVNVRLSALEALAPHTNEEIVRNGLLTALPRETAPLVQVGIIQLLVAAGERNAAPILDRLARDEAADKDVRDEARRALAELRAPLTPPADKQNASSNPTKPILT